MSAPGLIRSRPAGADAGAARDGRMASPAWPTVLALCAACLVWGMLFRPEIVAAVGVWYDSTAYSHCFLVLPTAAFLAWDRRDALAGLEVGPAAVPAALLALPVAVLWFAAERLGIMEVRQFAALAVLLLAVLAIVGWPACRAMAAPLLYLVFAVPFGAFITPLLQEITLALTMFFLGVANIPAASDGMVIDVPHATFFVAEACAGLRFLIASVAFGTLYACIIYRTAGRRALFIAASIAIPVLANGVRAFGIVALGYTLGSAEAAAADHLIYGWIFFSVVIVLLIIAGLPFRQDLVRPAQRLATLPMRYAGTRPWAPAALVLAVGAIGPAASGVLDRAAAQGFAPAPPVLAVDGCTAQPIASGAGMSTTALECGPLGRYTLAVTLFPPRSTAAPVQAALRRATGELQAEEVQFSSLHGDLPGRWTLVETSDPPHVTAVSSWRDGVPATGGLAGRLAQARASLLGARRAPVVVALAWAGAPAKLAPTEGEDIADAMTRLLARQAGWPAAIAALSETP